MSKLYEKKAFILIILLILNLLNIQNSISRLDKIGKFGIIDKLQEKNRVHKSRGMEYPAARKAPMNKGGESTKFL